MIELEDVVMEYPGHRALDGLRLSVPAGRVYAAKMTEWKKRFDDEARKLKMKYAKLMREKAALERRLGATLAGQRQIIAGWDTRPRMAFNADMVSLVKFLDMGTRAARYLR